MKKIYKMKIWKGFYVCGWSNAVEICTTGAEAFFDLGPEVEFHIQTSKPAGDNYYRMTKKHIQSVGHFWYFEDVEDEPDCSPLMHSVDDFIEREFPNRRTLYVSAYSYDEENENES